MIFEMHLDPFFSACGQKKMTSNLSSFHWFVFWRNFKALWINMILTYLQELLINTNDAAVCFPNAFRKSVSGTQSLFLETNPMYLLNCSAMEDVTAFTLKQQQKIKVL